MGFKVVAQLETHKPVSILIVEDEALIASYIEEVLGESGFHVAGIAASGPEALSLAAEAAPALALVDIRLTGPIDGIELACLFRQKYGLPSMHEMNYGASLGGLITYGPDIVDVYRRAGRYAGRILKGGKPAEMPMEEPREFRLLVNLKTAKTLGLTIPQSVLLRADEVIR